MQSKSSRVLTVGIPAAWPFIVLLVAVCGRDLYIRISLNCPCLPMHLQRKIITTEIKCHTKRNIFWFSFYLKYKKKHLFIVKHFLLDFLLIVFCTISMLFIWNIVHDFLLKLKTKHNKTNKYFIFIVAFGFLIHIICLISLFYAEKHI